MKEYETAIKINSLSKKYLKGALSEWSLRGDTFLFWEKIKSRSLIGKSKKEAFWALKNINLEVKKGEILGVIGNNGAGKSTLLKLMAGITPPTEGTIEIYGRMAPMLEIGAGFHDDLNGKDNIFLNGAIMGMSRMEIETHYAEILDFSGMSSFIETPLKYYSSGMKIRLAFAIAAFLQPEILLVDEVLAVGDIAFQKKCLLKMEERAHQGITILFVSHDMEAVKRICSRCVYLDSGKVLAIGTTALIVSQYLDNQNILQNSTMHVIRDLSKFVYISYMTLVRQQSEYLTTENIPLQLNLKVNGKLSFPVQIWMEVTDLSGQVLLYSVADVSKEVKHPGLLDIQLHIPPNTLLPGNYGIAFGVWNLNGWIELDKTEQKIDIKIVHELQIQTKQFEEVPAIDCYWEVKNQESVQQTSCNSI